MVDLLLTGPLEHLHQTVLPHMWKEEEKEEALSRPTFFSLPALTASTRAVSGIPGSRKESLTWSTTAWIKNQNLEVMKVCLNNLTFRSCLLGEQIFTKDLGKSKL